MRRPSRSLQPSLQLAGAFAVASSALPWRLPAPGFPADLAPEPLVPQPRDPFFIGAPNALSHSSLPLRFSFPLPSFPLLPFSSPPFFRSGRDHRDRRKSSTGVVRRYRARYPGYGTPPPVRDLVRTRAHTHARYPLTHRQCVPLSYQLIAGRSLSAWDAFSHGLHFPRPPPCARPRVPTRPVSAQPAAAKSQEIDWLLWKSRAAAPM